MEKTKIGYNPCFSGSSSATKEFAFKVYGYYEVTILVFLAALVQRSMIIPEDHDEQA